MLDFFKEPIVLSFIFSLLIFLATEFFYPIEGNGQNLKKQKHFWAIIIFIITFFQGFVLSKEFDSELQIDEVKQDVIGLMNKEIIEPGQQGMRTIDRSLTEINDNIKSMRSEFHSFQAKASGKEFYILKSKTEDAIAIYDKSSSAFPILENKSKKDRFWVRLTNYEEIEQPTVELYIHPSLTKGDEKSEFAFGVSENIIKFLSKGKSSKSLKVSMQIVQH